MSVFTGLWHLVDGQMFLIVPLVMSALVSPANLTVIILPTMSPKVAWLCLWWWCHHWVVVTDRQHLVHWQDDGSSGRRQSWKWVVPIIPPLAAALAAMLHYVKQTKEN